MPAGAFAMKKLLLLTSAALFTLSASAHAVQLLPPEPKMPDIMLGKWCAYVEPGIEKVTYVYAVCRRDCSKGGEEVAIKPNELFMFGQQACHAVRIPRL